MIRELLRVYDASRTNPGKPECTFAETLIFNEGWLLRGVLQEWQSWTQPARFSFLPFPKGIVVYSEAQLYTPFKARFQGDKQAEGHTHPDGIVGDFRLLAKSGAVLCPDPRYLAIFEAKMYSPLSKRTRNVPNYDQISRTAACIVHALLQTGPSDRCAAHLVVLYPQDSNEIQPGQYTGEHIERQIATRVRGYLSAKGHDQPNARFFAEWREVLPKIQSRSKASAQNHESPEWAKKAAMVRNLPGFSAMRNFLERFASRVRMSLKGIVGKKMSVPSMLC